MNTTASTVLAGLIVILGRWAQQKPVTIRIVVGVAVAALFLAVLGNVDEKLARGLGMVMLVAAMFIPPPGSQEGYVVSITKGLFKP